MIRKCEVADSPAIQKINQIELGYDYPVEKTAANIKRLLNDPKHHYLWVFEDDNTKKVEGYLHAEVFEETYFDRMFNVLALAVDSSAQKKGIGSQLMQTLEKQAKNLGMKEIRLNSGESRLGAHKFYEKLGYTSNKMQKRFGKTLK